MEGSSAENTGITDAADGAALAPKTRSRYGIALAIVAVFVVVGLIFRARSRKPVDVAPVEPPVLLQTAEPSGESGGEPEPESHPHQPHESVSANGFHGENAGLG